jgi:hypothetical protein
MLTMLKYPRTQHIEGSLLQDGDEDLKNVPFSTLHGKTLFVEEKVDGANAGLRFDGEGELWLQSRGHFLTGGPREKHFDLFKQWASTHATKLLDRIEDRYVLYGEWLYAKHTIWYDLLPHYFMVFDVYDLAQAEFLDSARRVELLRGLPVTLFEPLYHGPATTLEDLVSLVGPSAYQSENWRENLSADAEELNLDAEQILGETDGSGLMEGLYIYVEENGIVTERYKYVRADFKQTIIESGTHWLRRPIVPNRLQEEVDLFGSGV